MDQVRMDEIGLKAFDFATQGRDEKRIEVGTGGNDRVRHIELSQAAGEVLRAARRGNADAQLDPGGRERW